MAPIRVAIVADALVRRPGGVGRSVFAIARELAQLDADRVEVTIVARERPDAIDGIPFRRSLSPRVPGLPGSLFALQRPLTLRAFDIVHYMDSRPPLDFPLGRRVNAVTQHGFAPIALTDKIEVQRRYVLLNSALLRLARYADLTVTPSESEREELLKRVRMDPARVVAVHHGVDHDRFFPPSDLPRVGAVLAERFGIDGPYVLFVANYQRKKNPERLVEAFARVTHEHPDVLLVLAGSTKPRFRLTLELIERLRLQPRVRVLGHVDDDDVLRALYGGASVFALPSLHETFALPVLEAMACGAPVVTSNVYCLPEVCGDAAELVDPYSVEAIADGLARVLGDSSRAAELRERGIARAAGFTWRRSAEGHLAAYEAVLG